MVNYNDVLEAKKRIQEHVKKTEITQLDVNGKTINLKLESQQECGSFKVRGALNKILSLTDDERNKGVVASSAGNHAQGVAIAGTLTKCDTYIVMPSGAPKTKVKATENFGGNVILHGEVYDDAYTKALELSKEKGYVLAHPFDDNHVIAGQGTIGLEILEQLPECDCVVVPIGGGGIAAGIATAIKDKKPNTKIIGVQPEVICSMHDFYHGLEVRKDYIKSIADGTSVMIPGTTTRKIIKKHLDDIVVVSEKEIENAIKYIWDNKKVKVEGAGALSTAAVMANKIDASKFNNIVTIVSGSNIDDEKFNKIVLNK